MMEQGDMSALPVHEHIESDYLAFERRSQTKHEFYQGHIYAMAGASREHVLICTNLLRHLSNELDDQPCEVYGSDMRVKVAPTGLITYPDVSIVCAKPDFLDGEFDTLLNPQVLIEVLSPSTAKYDRTIKRWHYTQIPSVQDYLIVAQDKPHVILHTRKPNDPTDWDVYTAEHMTTAIAVPSLQLSLMLNDMYARVERK